MRVSRSASWTCRRGWWASTWGCSVSTRTCWANMGPVSGSTRTSRGYSGCYRYCYPANAAVSSASTMD
uniref:Putative secreted protein n=1 Tax=Anopheles marajoara TaxID=58244 RepID=A0A2M4CFS8_9DIPT